MVKYKLIYSLKGKFCLIFLFIGLFFSHFGQKNEQYYLTKLNHSKSDTSKVGLYITLSQLVCDNDAEKGMEYAKKALRYCNSTGYRKQEVFHALSYCSNVQGKSKDALQYGLQELKLIQNSKDEGKRKEAVCLENISSIYGAIGSYDKSIEYISEAMTIYKNIGANEDLYIAYINIAMIFINKNEFDQALYYLEVAENYFQKKNITDYDFYIYNGMSICYENTNQIKKAIESSEKSIEAIKNNASVDINSLATAYNNLASTYKKINEFHSALLYESEALELFKKDGDYPNVANVLFNLSITYQKLGMLKESNEYMMKFAALDDSINNMETKQIIHDLGIKYETEKKEQQNKLLQKDNEKKKLTLYFALAGIVLVCLILLIIFRNNRLISKVNKQLESQNVLINEQKNIVEEQRFLLEEKNKEITDSIKYAERIQGAILPPDQKWFYILPKSFVLNKPKDILSGDFYWIADTTTHTYCAAADCTGHGVPGALISIVNFNLLNKAVLERGLKEPGEILDAVNLWLTESLNQTTDESTIKDGMDIALIAIEKSNGKITYAGANNPLYLISKNELIEYKADKFPVGAYINEEIRTFSTKEIDYQFGDSLYLFSDGFADQFGGPNGKKFKYKQFKELLFEAKNLPVHEQKEFLYTNYRSWRGNLDQTDDILVIGLQL